MLESVLVGAAELEMVEIRQSEVPVTKINRKYCNRTGFLF